MDNSKKRLAAAAAVEAPAKAPASPNQAVQKFLGNDFMKAHLEKKQDSQLAQEPASKSSDRELHNVLFNLGMDPRIAKGLVEAIGALADTQWDPMAQLAVGPNGLQIWEPGIGMELAEMFQTQVMIEDIRTNDFLRATIAIFTGAPIVGVQPDEIVMYWKRIGFRTDIAEEMGNLVRMKMGMKEDPKKTNPEARKKLMGSMGKVPPARYEA